MKTTSYRTGIFKEREDLISFIGRYVEPLKEKDLLVISSKLVCLWKGLSVDYLSGKQKENLIRQESDACLKTKLAWLSIKSGMVMTNAGIDESNARGKLLLLPKDLYACAAEIRKALCSKYGLKKLGIIITDSMILPLRCGVIGAACGYAGFKGVRDEREKKDLFGKPLKVTQVNLADALAAAAAVEMGERAERRAGCRIEGAPVRFVGKTDPSEITYPPEQDLYAPLFQAVGLIKRRKK